MDRMLTAKDIADALRMAPSYVADKITHRPDFPKPYRLGRVRRWRENEVKAWLESRREKS